MPKFVTLINGLLTLGFKTTADAEMFLNRQSSNPDWKAQFRIEFLNNKAYETTALLICPAGLALDLRMP